MNVYEAIRREHSVLLKLLRKLEDTNAGRPEERQEILRQVAKQLEALAIAEERQVYPRLAQERSLRAIVAELREENRRARGLLSRLKELEPRDELFQRTAEALHSQVVLHYDREHWDLLVPLQKVLDEEEAELMGERLEAEKRRVEDELRA